MAGILKHMFSSSRALRGVASSNGLTTLRSLHGPPRCLLWERFRDLYSVRCRLTCFEDLWGSSGVLLFGYIELCRRNSSWEWTDSLKMLEVLNFSPPTHASWEFLAAHFSLRLGFGGRQRGPRRYLNYFTSNSKFWRVTNKDLLVQNEPPNHTKPIQT